MAKFKGAVLSCQICGDVFKVPPSRAKSALYCSIACASIGRGRARELPKVSIVCKWCGRTFFERPCHADRRIYCSQKCRYSDPSYGEAISARTMGEKNAAWVGGITEHSDGYVYERCSDHPFAGRGYVLQHRLVVERNLREYNPESPCLIKIGENMYLDPSLSVHHRDEVKTNNDPENLQVMTASDHSTLHNQLRRSLKINSSGE